MMDEGGITLRDACGLDCSSLGCFPLRKPTPSPTLLCTYNRTVDLPTSCGAKAELGKQRNDCDPQNSRLPITAKDFKKV